MHLLAVYSKREFDTKFISSANRETDIQEDSPEKEDKKIRVDKTKTQQLILLGQSCGFLFQLVGGVWICGERIAQSRSSRRGENSGQKMEITIQGMDSLTNLLNLISLFTDIDAALL